MANKLLVFTGKPGVGKTTLISAAFPDKKVIDVRPFVIAYRVNNIVPEEKTIDGYKDMYKHLADLNDPLLILELGTNHPELNISELKKLSNTRDIHLFLCNADTNTCRERMIQRNRGDNMEAMERRLKKDFPNSHLSLLENSQLRHTILNMEQELDENTSIVLRHA
jgi:dephospho-CoA kinase